MADTETLYNIFESFCAFGSNRNLSQTGSNNNLSGPQMDGAKFAKFTRECNILDRLITPTEVDITFNKIKGKTARKISFDEFQKCLKSLASKKYPSRSESEAYAQLTRQICQSSARPTVISNVKPAQEEIVNRLNNPSNFTGTQRSNFESKGLMNTSGSNSNLSSSRPSVAPNNAGAGKRKQASIATISSEKLDQKANQPKKTESTLPKITSTSKSNLAAKSNNNVFDRLTSHHGYTGTHKLRFDESGNGLGLNGRDTTSKGLGSQPSYHGGNVHSLSQILRN